MNFCGKEGHPNIQPSTRPGIEPGTSGLGGRDLTTAPTPPLKTRKTIMADEFQMLANKSKMADEVITSKDVMHF